MVSFYGWESQVYKIIYKAVPSYDYEEGPGLHKSDISCGVVSDITSQPYIFRNMLKNSILPSKAQIIREPQIMNYDI